MQGAPAPRAIEGGPQMVETNGRPICGFIGLGSQGAPMALRMIAGGYSTVLWARRTETLDPYRGTELEPGPAAQSDDELDRFLRANAETIYHPVGTARMGTDDRAVVDPTLNVRGIEHLRVVDASVMPTLIGGNTNAPTIMIA